MSKNLNSLSKRDPLGLRKLAYFERWCSYSIWSFQEAVALLIGLEPNEKFTNSFYTTSEFDEIYKCLTNDLSIADEHSPHEVDWNKSVITPQTFVKWAEEFLNKPVFLPVQVNYKDQYFNKCTAEDQRIAEYTVNLEKIKACLAACSSKEQKNEVEDCGFKWALKDTDLEILRKGLIDYKFIENITYVKFKEAFCYGPSSTRMIWLSTVVPLRYLLDELKNGVFIENDDRFAQAMRVFQKRQKNGVLTRLSQGTLYQSDRKYIKEDSIKGKKLIDAIIRDLKDDKPIALQSQKE